ncbi:alpha-hydroxy acid oxidase [Nocardia sp. 348MFTsu5.1]|uniref:alpha-hydroxy acid oxidase n=1 Tax=Nocardia sp. 348MFTsu5.1 TaxID=1172185 RepID=UPI000368CADE|nr:alpha-hydroxy acid oxidase [Nocardia sp. 348MFTsu5.1]
MNAVDTGSAREYLEGGAGTVPADNEQQWRRYAIYPRPLAGVSSVDLSMDIFGHRIDLPVLAAASAAHGLWHPDGEVETARGVRAAGSILALSHGSTRSPAQVAPHSGPYLQQLYLPQERDVALPFITEVTGLGAIGLILTIDQIPVPFEQPFRLAGQAGAVVPHWQAYPPGTLPASSFSAADITWLTGHSELPVIVKGVMHPDDARAAIDAGAGAIVVSNHGGRQFPGAATPAEVLSSVAAAVNGRVPVYVDSGIRGADDVVRALCLGADAVFLGRPIVRALAAGGASAVTTLLTELRDQVASLLALAGVGNLADCGPGMLLARSAGGVQ